MNAPETVPVALPFCVVLDISVGSIRLIAADRFDAEVEVRPGDAAESRDVRAAQRVLISNGGGVLRVDGEPAGHRVLGIDPGSVAVTVWLPLGSRVEAKAAVADFRGIGSLGDVTYEGAVGSVQLEEIASGRLAMQDGGITVGRLGGSAELSTQRGDIAVAEATRGTVTLRTQSGQITVGAVGGVSATLDAGAPNGRIHNSLQNSAGAEAELRIHATTADGDVTARSLEQPSAAVPADAGH
ncbi:conserved hypothetical protein [Catenulispora acidiphila DSM 44928]|uniref:DUF4097 domain-containing protein n=1 Tax=Catenulispora acidiphila (strain DSM 44928 / JCM 14897 / NBRC 102108 / NRRL B-24433 / ID139908) TaxID=479433 RepID=C7Q120_CATAD|nr:DUF4097 family beta strand repeat-containing protein [Catenulispora acidiphila]ACU71695.1 conserved hypothetical protein [Catenulispora acidiphila DSM 44928]